MGLCQPEGNQSTQEEKFQYVKDGSEKPCLLTGVRNKVSEARTVPRLKETVYSNMDQVSKIGCKNAMEKPRI